MSIESDLNKTLIEDMLENIEKSPLPAYDDESGLESDIEKARQVFNQKKPSEDQVKAVAFYGERSVILVGHI